MGCLHRWLQSLSYATTLFTTFIDRWQVYMCPLFSVDEYIPGRFETRIGRLVDVHRGFDPQEVQLKFNLTPHVAAGAGCSHCFPLPARM